MKVPALSKPAGQMCQHQSATGCGNYHDRPPVCRDWHCMWVRDRSGVFAEHHRPDRLGVFFTASAPDASGRQHLFAHETEPGAAETPEPRIVIEFLARFAPVEIIPGKLAQPAVVTQLTISARAVA